MFLFWSGKTKRDLAVSLPRVATASDHLPRYLKREEIQRLIESMRTDDAIGRRNYAMLLLMARLGFRAPEVIAIQLGDIDWRAGEILIGARASCTTGCPFPRTWARQSLTTSETARPGTHEFMRIGEDTASAF
jgi:integrase/recombinase XerD